MCRSLTGRIPVPFKGGDLPGDNGGARGLGGAQALVYVDATDSD
jgi:hypothetical protein